LRRCWGESELVLLNVSFVAVDPERTCDEATHVEKSTYAEHYREAAK